MYALIGLIGFFGIFVCFVRLLIHAVKKKSKKGDGIGILVCILLFSAGVAMTPDKDIPSNKVTDSPNTPIIKSSTSNVKPQENKPPTKKPDSAADLDAQQDKEPDNINQNPESTKLEDAKSELNQETQDKEPNLTHNDKIDSEEIVTSKTKETPDNQIVTENSNNFDTYDNAEQQETNDKWVLNIKSMKIHYPSCSQVKKIAPKNYSTSNSKKDDLIAQGYTTCGVCH